MSQKLIKLVFVEDGYVMKIRGSRKGFKLICIKDFLLKLRSSPLDYRGRHGEEGHCVKRGCETKFLLIIHACALRAL